MVIDEHIIVVKMTSRFVYSGFRNLEFFSSHEQSLLTKLQPNLYNYTSIPHNIISSEVKRFMKYFGCAPECVRIMANMIFVDSNYFCNYCECVMLFKTIQKFSTRVIRN